MTWAQSDRPGRGHGHGPAGRRPAAWNQWPEVVHRDSLAPKFLGDLPHTWVGSDFVRSLLVYRLEYANSTNDDRRVSAGHWLYMSLRRIGRDDEAAEVLRPIRRDMQVIENDAYHRLMLLYKGELPVDSVVWVPADGAAPAIVELLGGHIDLICCSVPEALAQRVITQPERVVSVSKGASALLVNPVETLTWSSVSITAFHRLLTCAR